MSKDNTTKPLCLQFEKDFHTDVKRYAIQNDMTMQVYIEGLIRKALKKEIDYVSLSDEEIPETLESLLGEELDDEHKQ